MSETEANETRRVDESADQSDDFTESDLYREMTEGIRSLGRMDPEEIMDHARNRRQQIIRG